MVVDRTRRKNRLLQKAASTTSSTPAPGARPPSARLANGAVEDLPVGSPAPDFTPRGQNKQKPRKLGGLLLKGLRSGALEAAVSTLPADVEGGSGGGGGAKDVAPAAREEDSHGSPPPPAMPPPPPPPPVPSAAHLAAVAPTVPVASPVAPPAASLRTGTSTSADMEQRRKHLEQLQLQRQQQAEEEERKQREKERERQELEKKRVDYKLSFRERLERFYVVHNREKLGQLDFLVEKYQRPDLAARLFEQMVAKYGAEPNDQTVAAARRLL